MNLSFDASQSALAAFLRAVRSFHAAAFVALAFFYYASYCLPPLPSCSLQLAPFARPPR
jgi:hypothetical protein